MINRRNGCSTSLFIKLLACKPFQNRLEQKPQETFEFENLIPKPRHEIGFDWYTKDEKHLSLRALSPNPIGVINRRNGWFKTMNYGLEKLIFNSLRD
ncbi:hypothetical protein [Methanosarcina sp. Kolksee]|uniref:hypothetical protein n=1 Tax=Methanosarcina sp. Kolksee TaxID=1434099 RepID=UPI0012E008D3|nr:hypothetical protein [Methanosarcina sp. Kolksee]